ncbi:putative tRNA pseudouridine synthase Pus10 [Mactra antiquata]
MTLFTSDTTVIANITKELVSCGCCARCTMRYLGLKDMALYKGNYKEMQTMVEQYMNIKSDDESPSTVNDANIKDTVGGTDDVKDINNTQSVVVEVKKENDDACAIQTDDSNEVIDKSNDTNTESSTKCKACVVCLGILQHFAEDEFLKKVQSNIENEGFCYTLYMCSLMIPVCVILREHAMMLHLKEKFSSVYGNKTYLDISAVKDVWKWRCGPVLCDLLQAPFDVKSPFDITLTFLYQNSNKECSFLLDNPDNDTFRKRKQDRRYNRKKPNFAVYNRANVSKAVKDMPEDDFKRSYQCPPLYPRFDTTCDIKCQNENVFLGGRYNKYSRILSQSPWIIEGVRKSESSVEELICTEINNNFQPDSSKFSSSGREDVDVLMLGNGRPFVVELMNPRRREFSQEEINNMQKTLNSSTEDIKCSDLQIVSKDDTNILKEGEIDKVKKYRALCWCKEPVTDEQLHKLSSLKELTILQKTPIRVLHRRPLATRDRIIHNICTERIDNHHFRIDMSTQAGTYVKEFVHGDFGRTKPNLNILLGQDCDILELDVTAVELDWPKKIDST